MPDAGTIAKLLTETSPTVVFYLGLLAVIWKLGALYITKHFEKMVPIYERLADSVGKMAERVPAQLESQARSQQGLLEASERQAAALEQTAKLIPVLDRISEREEQAGRTMRILARRFEQELRGQGAAADAK